MTRATHRLHRALLTTALTGGIVAGTAVVISAEPAQDPPPEPEGGVTTGMLHESVTVFNAADAVRLYDPSGHVIALGDEREVEDGETTISLSTDLLFTENSWDLPSSAPRRIAELVSDVPDGATVQVVGHTDTQQPVGHDFDNQELSENRAEAVAEVLRDERPDLDLEVSGLGDTQPAVTPDPEDPTTHAANRRVEISYGG